MKHLISLIFLLLSLALPSIVSAQNVSINGNGSLPDVSAMLDISSSTSGLLIPRMTTSQQNAIASPANGLLIFNTTNNVSYVKRFLESFDI